ncbi:sulfite exporter TauE/SafE family protein [Sulfuricella sp.]|uniref:sulfite exporter TauE/SafE family protein n=1 Tax=Sulfuricella sp. TaxID=2099377 RepID=UPI002C61E564|nr:sulfite exporter TauE/SafE family protein [Sulfuricella sp.]HUX63088.1 sulfite exporter TauE/SafE family protein [Sulfuricella sp.]
MIIIAIFAGAITGIVLGLFGSGGSIIAMPALMYLLNVEAKSAIAMSLGIVAVTATISGWDNWRRGNVDVKIAAVFGLFGVIGTYGGARLGVLTPVAVQLTLFALIMYAAAWKMLRKNQIKPAPAQFAGAGGPNLAAEDEAITAHMGHIAVHGIGVGILTGLVGVGGGFLIVPALVLLSGIPMKIAVGTSLAIVAAKSYSGFAGYMGAVPIDWTIMLSFTTVTVMGSFAGTRIAHRFSQEALKKWFGIFLIFVATYIMIKSVI